MTKIAGHIDSVLRAIGTPQQDAVVGAVKARSSVSWRDSRCRTNCSSILPCLNVRHIGSLPRTNTLPAA